MLRKLEDNTAVNQSASRQLEQYLKIIDPTFFYLYRYKTQYCQNFSKDHDWNHCVYAHKSFDYRRPPDQYFYVPEKCKSYNQETGQGCREECIFSHTTFERLYHPFQYKTNLCQQYLKKRKLCAKGELCAFVHCSNEMRNVQGCDKMFPFELIKQRLVDHLHKRGKHDTINQIIINF